MSKASTKPGEPKNGDTKHSPSDTADPVAATPPVEAAPMVPNYVGANWPVQSESHWRTNADGTRVKVDSDPSNDWHDGSNSRDRYWRKKLPTERLMWFGIGMLTHFIIQVVLG